MVTSLIQYKGENSIEEDKEQDYCFIDFFLIDSINPPKVFNLVSIPLIDRINPSKVSDPIFVPSSEFKSSIEPTPENQMIGKVYSRKKAAIPQLIQV
ncbi:hypothetical protein CK203_074760 [Vitis vinifera]|uniref:Uncharacterized protein n=1 Tax=Vitis vinifera TaxID=29760 RepID=A0A438DLX2_VITVI|nr:hypothetical protein CK203_074760 [Vitis vinifera]